ncbi:hypothetical protein [Desulfogranum marinum]|uniref:hypothetical protein n=1 Tax=Desulfogranum marinum TaxID=453220 RepID=UPI0019647AAD|nr:hypothetical protein [Desulfogranum marinum]MBM9512329.1 hypothetical protein [Desulfogranum marinum]
MSSSSGMARKIQKQFDSVDFYEMHGEISSKVSILQHLMIHGRDSEVNAEVLFDLSYLVADINQSLDKMATVCEYTQDYFYWLNEERNHTP